MKKTKTKAPKPKTTNKSSVPRNKLSGKGDYKIQKQPGLFEQISSGAPEVLSMLGDSFLPGSGPIIKPLSKAALRAFGKLTGFGDYDIKYNSIIGDNTEHPPAVFGHGATRIKDSEFVQFLSIPQNPNFLEMAAFLINPANEKLFPKLSQTAKLFQQYYLHGLVFRLESTCSESVTNSNNLMSIPVVMAMTNYDLNLPKPGNAKKLLNQYFASSARCNKDLMHPIECDPALQPMKCLYIWDKTTFTKDPNLYNSGQTFIFSEGGNQTAAFQAYKLWVDYDIELIKPTLAATKIGEDYWQGTTPSTSNPFGTSFIMETDSYHSGYPEYPYVLSGNTLVFDPSFTGEVVIEVFIIYSTATTNNLTITPDGVGVVANNWFLSGTASGYNNYGQSSAGWFDVESFSIINGGTITFGNISATNWSSTELVVRIIA